MAAAANVPHPHPTPLEGQPPSVSYFEISVLLLPFAAAYCLLLFPRAAQFVIFDRYLLELIAVALVYLLRVHQDRISTRVPLLSYGMLAVFAVVAVGGTHDLFALERARMRLFDDLQQRGIPPTAIRGGFELDAMTQMRAWGYINDPRILVPRDAFHPQPLQPFRAAYPECSYTVEEFVPVVQARYALATDDSACVLGTPVGSASYRTWLPLATHAVVAGRPRYP